MLKTETKEIDGLTFRIQQLSGWQANEFLFKFTTSAGQPVMTMVSEMRGGLRGAQLEAIGDAFAQLGKNLPWPEFRSLLEKLLSGACVMKNGAAMPVLDCFDSTFAGKIMTLYKLAAACFQLNYSDFFAVLPAMSGGEEPPSSP